MIKVSRKSLRTWLQIAALAFVGSWSAAAVAGEAGPSARWSAPPQVVANPFVAEPPSTPWQSKSASAADPPSTPLANPTIAAEPPAPEIQENPAPMYRLPVAETFKREPRKSPEVPPSKASVPPAATSTEQENDAEPASKEFSDGLLDELEQLWSEEFELPPESPVPTAPTTVPINDSAQIRVAPYAPTVEELSRQLLPAVQKAYGLARQGAVYAAQAEFIQVLRRIAQAKDAAAGVDDHSRALATGLRALDEADDFMPQGVELEGELNVGIMASSHRTPILHDASPNLRPDEAVALYHRYARDQLARAVAGEQAGSMALYGLGKVQNRLAYESSGELRHERQAMTMFLAALDAGPTNHLAANEIGVLAARAGQSADAAAVFRRTIDIAPSSTAYHNLAVVEQKLGQFAQADANERYAQFLAGRDRASGLAAQRSGVQWVRPQDLSRVAQPMPSDAGTDQITQTPAQPLSPPTFSEAKPVARWPQKLFPGMFHR